MFALMSFSRADGSLALMSDMREYFSVTFYLAGSYGFYELIKVADITWGGYKSREEKQEGK